MGDGFQDWHDDSLLTRQRCFSSLNFHTVASALYQLGRILPFRRGAGEARPPCVLQSVSADGGHTEPHATRRARQILGDGETAKSMVGTPNYMSPELFPEKGEKLAYDFKSDVWALGCVLYELTALRPAFSAFVRVALTRPPRLSYPPLARVPVRFRVPLFRASLTCKVRLHVRPIWRCSDMINVVEKR
jgi:serine/threonine protein kinase